MSLIQVIQWITELIQDVTATLKIIISSGAFMKNLNPNSPIDAHARERSHLQITCAQIKPSCRLKNCHTIDIMRDTTS